MDTIAGGRVEASICLRRLMGNDQANHAVANDLILKFHVQTPLRLRDLLAGVCGYGLYGRKQLDRLISPNSVFSTIFELNLNGIES